MAGPGLLPQWHVSKLAAKHVKVVLGGQGGDEPFSGYVRHLVLRLEAALAAAIRSGETQALRTLAPHLAALDGYGPLLRGHFGSGLFESAHLWFLWYLLLYSLLLLPLFMWLGASPDSGRWTVWLS